MEISFIKTIFTIVDHKNMQILRNYKNTKDKDENMKTIKKT